jgi:hypothetical protein
LPAIAGLVTLVFTTMAWGATGCITGLPDNDEPDVTAIFAKGKSECASLTGTSGLTMVGCMVTKGSGTCDIKDADGNVLTTVTSSISSDGSLSFTTAGPDGADPVPISWDIFNGIVSGNTCLFGSETGMLNRDGHGFSTDGETYTGNAQEVWFCLDPGVEVAETEPELQPCVLYGSGGGTIDLIEGVDCGSFADGTIVEVYTPVIDEDSGDVTGQTLQQCICNDGGTAGGVYPCNLSGVDDGDPSTVEGCFHKNNGDVEAPIIVEFFPDAKRCSTDGGTRSCDCIDNPFTACNECKGEC